MHDQKQPREQQRYIYDKLSTPISPPQENHGFQTHPVTKIQANSQPAFLSISAVISFSSAFKSGCWKESPPRLPFHVGSFTLQPHNKMSVDAAAIICPHWIFLGSTNCPPRPQLTNQLYNVQAHKSSPTAATPDVVQSVDSSIVVVSVSTKLVSPCTRL